MARSILDIALNVNQAAQQQESNNLLNQLRQEQVAQFQQQAPLQQQVLEQQVQQGQFQQQQQQAQSQAQSEQAEMKRAINAGNIARSAKAFTGQERADYLQSIAPSLEALGLPLAQVDLNNVSDQVLDQFISIGDALSPKKVDQPFQKTAEGLVFNPNTGKFNIDPVARRRLDDLAKKSAATGVLDFKDKQSLNKDVTGIIKSTVSIKRFAEELEALEGVGTAAAKLGAVFKFMKSLDPTSVVRETEQGSVYAASGAASQLAGQLNSLLGEGKLSEAGFKDIVNTSKSIADANINSTVTEVGSLLDSFEDTLPASFKSKIKDRVPIPFGGQFAGQQGGVKRIKFDAQGKQIP